MTSSPVYPSAVRIGSPVWIPMRTRIPLGIHLAALMRGKRSPQQGAVPGQHLGVAVPEVHRQGGAILDVGVQHREGAARQLRHGCAPLRPLRVMAAYAPPFRHSAIEILRGLSL